MRAKRYYSCDSSFILEAKENLIFQDKQCRLIESNQAILLSTIWNGGTGPLRLYTYKESDKVYLWYPNHNQWGIFFDFGAQKGDTLSLLNPYWSEGDEIQYRVAVDSVYMKVIEGVSLKAYYINPAFDPNEQTSWAGEIIENIGNVWQPIPILGVDENTGMLKTMIRYESNAGNYLPIYIYSLQFGVTDIGLIRGQICSTISNIFPAQNPISSTRLTVIGVSQTSTITLTLNGLNKTQYALFDDVGREVYIGRFSTDSPFSVDLSMLPKGVYACKLQTLSEFSYIKIFNF